jgi:hypothetical protein
MVRLSLAIVLAFLTPLAFAQDAGRPVAGTVSLVEGDVRFLDPNQQPRRPALGDSVYEGDSIVTGSNGEVHLDMQDGGYIGVRPGTRMRIVDFKAEGGSDDGFLIGLLEGSFRAVTGWITRSGARRAEVQTPTATIGIRGTDYEPLVIPEGSKAGEPGTYNRVNIGETEMRSKEGSVIVKPNQAGFVPQRGALRPRVLDRVPGVFRATRNEKRFDGLHQRIHQNLEQRRQQRAKQIDLRRRGQGLKPAASQKPAAERRAEERRREEALKQKRLQQAEKHPFEARRQDHAKAAKKGGPEERRKRHGDKRE